MQFKIFEKYFQFELHTLESQDFYVQASQRLVFRKLHIEEQVQVEDIQGEAKREKHHIIHLKKIY